MTQQAEAGFRVIYNGLAAGQWFNPSDAGIVLTSYEFLDIACDNSTPVPGPDVAYAALSSTSGNLRLGGDDVDALLFPAEGDLNINSTATFHLDANSGNL
ncbi:MAG: hypothetical protein ACJAUP_001297 [Cellvibrionaceae bacterium]